MQLKTRVIAISIVLGLFAGFIDTIIDYLFFYKDKSLLDLMIFNVPVHEIYVRSVLLLCFTAFGLIVGNIISRLQKALQNVKTLTGFLPMCAWCKNIRNDEGYWQKIEAYFKSHSDLDFTHAICNDCAKKEYPELYTELKKKTEKEPQI